MVRGGTTARKRTGLRRDREREEQGAKRGGKKVGKTN